MAATDSYTLSESEARRMRRGAFLPILLILPMALMFGLDESKSQPMHLLMTLAVATLIGGIVVSVSWYGTKRRIAEFSRTTLSISDGQLCWQTGTRRNELKLDDLSRISVAETLGKRVRQIVLHHPDRNPTTLEGYERMNDLLDRIAMNSNVEIVRTRRWMFI